MYEIGEGSIGIQNYGALCKVYGNELLIFKKTKQNNKNTFIQIEERNQM